MPKRSPIVVFLLVWITLGFYGVYWYFGTLSFLNDHHPNRSYRIRRIAWFVVGYFLLYIGVFAATMRLHPYSGRLGPQYLVLFTIGFVMAIAWNVMVPFALWHLSVRLRETQAHHRMSEPIKPALTVFAYLLWFSAFPYVQHHLNRLIDRVAPAKRSGQRIGRQATPRSQANA